jgi:hypothetical protein
MDCRTPLRSVRNDRCVCDSRRWDTVSLQDSAEIVIASEAWQSINYKAALIVDCRTAPPILGTPFAMTGVSSTRHCESPIGGCGNPLIMDGHASLAMTTCMNLTTRSSCHHLDTHFLKWWFTRNDRCRWQGTVGQRKGRDKPALRGNILRVKQS